MKIRIISSKDEISTLGGDEEFIHLSFRPSSKDIFILVQMCPNLKGIYLSKSYKKTISRSSQMFLEIQDIALIEAEQN